MNKLLREPPEFGNWLFGFCLLTLGMLVFSMAPQTLSHQGQNHLRGILPSDSTSLTRLTVEGDEWVVAQVGNDDQQIVVFYEGKTNNAFEVIPVGNGFYRYKVGSNTFRPVAKYKAAGDGLYYIFEFTRVFRDPQPLFLAVPRPLFKEIAAAKQQLL